MGTQTLIAEQVIEQEAEYVLALKDNHQKLHQDYSLTLWLTPTPPSLISNITPLRKVTVGLKSAVAMPLMLRTISPTLTRSNVGLAYNR
jgi:hypothetical protein